MLDKLGLISRHQWEFFLVLLFCFCFGLFGLGFFVGFGFFSSFIYEIMQDR